MAFWVFGSTLYHTLVLGLPSAQVMGIVGLLALAANLASVLLLMPYRDGDANVRSVWLCSRNDAIGNLVVMAAAFGVWGTSSAWPDLAVAGLMAGLFLTSSVQILRRAWRSIAKAQAGLCPPSSRSEGQRSADLRDSCEEDPTLTCRCEPQISPVLRTPFGVETSAICGVQNLPSLPPPCGEGLRGGYS